MGTARQLVVEQVAQLPLDDIAVRPYARLNRQPAKVTLLVRMDEVTPLADVAQNARTYNLSLILLGTKLVTDDDQLGGVDDELDDALDHVLHTLDEATTDVVWTSAKRGTYEATSSPCYLIAVELSGTFQPESE